MLVKATECEKMEQEFFDYTSLNQVSSAKHLYGERKEIIYRYKYKPSKKTAVGETNNNRCELTEAHIYRYKRNATNLRN